MSALALLQEGITMTADSTATGMTDLTKEVLVWDLIIGRDANTGEISISNLLVMIIDGSNKAHTYLKLVSSFGTFIILKQMLFTVWCNSKY